MIEASCGETIRSASVDGDFGAAAGASRQHPIGADMAGPDVGVTLWQQFISDGRPVWGQIPAPEITGVAKATKSAAVIHLDALDSDVIAQHRAANPVPSLPINSLLVMILSQRRILRVLTGLGP